MKILRFIFMHMASALLIQDIVTAEQIYNGDEIYDGPSVPVTESPAPDNACASGHLTSYQSGSVIDCRDQTLFQSIPLIGTDFSLNYSSRSQPAAVGLGRHLKMNIEKYTDNRLTRFGKLLGIKVSALLAGQTYEQSYTVDPSDNLSEPFIFELNWDGRNESGAVVQGLVEATIKIEYTFEGKQGTDPATVFMERKLNFGHVEAAKQKLGGWTLDSYHSYDTAARTAALGSGLRLPVGNKRFNAAFRTDANGNTLVPADNLSVIYHFSPNGQHIATSDALSSALIHTFQHDGNGNLISITNRNGLVTKIERDSNGHISAIIGPFGAKTKFVLNADNLISEIIDPKGRSTHFSYLTGSYAGLMSSMTDPMGRTKVYNYSEKGLLVSASDFKGSVKTLATSNEYSSYINKKTVTHTSPLGRKSTYETEEHEAATRRINIEPSGRKTETYQVPQSYYTRIEHADGLIQAIWSAPDQRFPERTAPQSVDYSKLFDARIVVPPSITYTRSYELSNLDDPFSLTSYTETKSISGIGDFTMVFDKPTMTQVATTPSGRKLTRKFDSKGQLVSEQSGNLEPVKVTYNEKGQMIKSVQGNRLTKFTYNSSGLLATVTNALGETQRFTYNLNNLLKSHTLPDNDTYEFTYNANNKLRNILMSDNRTYKNTYNINSFQTTFHEPRIDNENYLWQWKYNFDNDITRYILPDASSVSYTYDTQGRLQKESGPNFQRIYTYSTGGLLTGIQWSDRDKMIFVRDDKHVLSMTSDGEVKGTLTYGWDNTARLNSLTLNDQTIASFSYLPEGDIIKANDLTISRNSANGLISETSISNVKTSQSYNSFGELTAFSAKVAAKDLFTYNIERDSLGRITRIKSRNGSQASDKQFKYDRRGQLALVQQKGDTKPYNYSRSGNRLRPGGKEVYDSQDRLVSD